MKFFWNNVSVERVMSFEIRARKPETRITVPEGSHNGIAAVLKTADRKVMRVRIPRPPLLTVLRGS